MSRHSFLIPPVARALVLITTIGFLLNSGVGTSPSTTCDAQGTCPQPAVYGRQPYVSELAPLFDQAGTNQLGANGPDLLQVWSGYPPSQAIEVAPYVPCILLKAIGYTETSGWKQFNANYGQFGYTRISFDCGYGIMQITSAMDGSGGFEPHKVAAEPAYNIGTGAKLLMGKWNALPFYIGANDPHVVENWYYAVWAYNGWVPRNNPNNPEFPENRGVWECGANPEQYRGDWPYQELIWGCAANPPGSDHWTSVNLTLPPRWQITDPPPTHIDTPQPSHSSCSVIHLPLILNIHCSDSVDNGGFEDDLNGWDTTGRVAPNYQLHFSGAASARLSFYNTADNTLSQDVYIPTTGPTGAPIVSARLSYAWHMTTTESTQDAYDYFYASLRHPDYPFDLKNLETLTDNSAAGQWYQSSFDVQDYIGQRVEVFFRATNDMSFPTSFFLDDVTLYTCDG